MQKKNAKKRAEKERTTPKRLLKNRQTMTEWRCRDERDCEILVTK